ncbi:MAG: hypothetical protein NTY74_08560 [Ignavibacteriae bacterium]|nr:hypothetical protein [Ignavibacteriota bacterium]
MKHRKSLVFKRNNHDRDMWKRWTVESDNKLELRNIFFRSFFYAAEQFEVRIMSIFVKITRSLVFCGSKMTEEMFLSQMDTAPDYKVIGYRKVELDEIISKEWFPTFMEGFNNPIFNKEQLNQDIKQPFAYYVVYDLRKQLPEEYTYNRFRILYVCGEPVSTYHALYYSNKGYPEFVARIYNKFHSKNELLTEEGEQLHSAVINNPYGKPKAILIGGGDNVRNNHDIPIWKEYKLDSKFMMQYGIHVEDNIVIWSRKIPLN